MENYVNDIIHEFQERCKEQEINKPSEQQGASASPFICLFYFLAKSEMIYISRVLFSGM